MSIRDKVKVLLLGDFATGKTTLKKCFLGEEISEIYLSTIGVDISTYTYEDIDHKIIFQIWDIGGQPEYKLIRKKQYAGTEGGLLVFDKNRLETFEHLDGWLKELNSAINKVVPVILVGNKNDLLTDNENKAIDKKGMDFVQEYKNKYQFIELKDYISTSALKGYNVEQAFIKLGRNIIIQKTEELGI